MTDNKALEDKIVELYRAGYSQKDIAQQLQIGPILTRNILQKEGFETHKFRALDDSVMRVVIQLVSNGVQFADIEMVCDISFHAIREVVARHNMQYVSRRVRGGGPGPVLQEEFERNEVFHLCYLKGISFCLLCEEFKLSNKQILNEFLSVDRNDISLHREELKCLVLEDAAQDFSVTAIAKRHSISMSVVRKILRNEDFTVPPLAVVDADVEIEAEIAEESGLLVDPEEA